MDTHAISEPRICDAIWSVAVLLDYSESIAGYVPRDRIDWRPEYPAGDFAFSLGEQIKHIADTRVYVANTLSGTEAAYEKWAGEYPGRTSAWTFREGSYDEIMESLRFARSLVQPWIERPYSEMLLPTEGTRRAWERTLATKREAGEDAAELAAKGPGTLASSILFLTAHENGHRTVLQTLLRQAGIAVERLA